MIWKNLQIAVFVFFAWLIADAASSLLSAPLDGVYYPLESGRIKRSIFGFRLGIATEAGDWTDKRQFAALFFLLMFGAVWWLFVRREGAYKGTRIAALISAFLMAPFWIVTSVSADLYDLSINGYWLASMVYCNVSFFLYGFIGRGNTEDLYF